MTGSENRPTADMLLVDARRRRLLAERAASTGALSPTTDESVREVGLDPAIVLVADEDAIIEDDAPGRNRSATATIDHDRALLQRAGVHCYRPLITVTLARLAWSGAIDHGLLHEAIACAPFDAGSRAPNIARRAAAPALRNAPLGEPSLYVRLGEDDVIALERALDSAAADVGERLASAALLPDSLLGAPARAAYAASQALAGYRSAALVAAWREIMGAAGLAEVTRDRDSAAVRLLSTMRALLGEA
ncbi:MAG TPA: hypothetical protein VID19_01005 [Candidatus Eremiobacteraceae bacterium]